MRNSGGRSPSGDRGGMAREADAPAAGLPGLSEGQREKAMTRWRLLAPHFEDGVPLARIAEQNRRPRPSQTPAAWPASGHNSATRAADGVDPPARLLSSGRESHVRVVAIGGRNRRRYSRRCPDRHGAPRPQPSSAGSGGRRDPGCRRGRLPLGPTREARSARRLSTRMDSTSCNCRHTRC
jgi:hypothetical protein